MNMLNRLLDSRGSKVVTR